MRILALVLLGLATSFLLMGCPGATSQDGGVDAGPELAHFSFFVTSLRALQELSNDQSGFGGDLRYGETGPGAGLRGADKLCAAIAERSMPGASSKQWRAFLSVSSDGTGAPVHAIDRIGNGPWYDRTGRLLATSRGNLLSERPLGGDPAIRDDFPNEDGVPNHAPDPIVGQVDNHDMLTGTNDRGQLYGPRSTCLDWTSKSGNVALEGKPRVGHSWPRSDFAGIDGGLPGFDGGFPGFDGGFPGFDGGLPDGGGDCAGLAPGASCSVTVMGMTIAGSCAPGPGGLMCRPPMNGFDGGGFPFPDAGVSTTGINNWMSSLDEAGCAPGVNLIETGGPSPTQATVGSGGGYGGFYCFALTP